jgi:hypothetical protein
VEEQRFSAAFKPHLRLASALGFGGRADLEVGVAAEKTGFTPVRTIAKPKIFRAGSRHTNPHVKWVEKTTYSSRFVCDE